MATSSGGDEFSSTLAISIGGAGSRMLAAVRDTAEREGFRDDVELVAIDSKTEDIEANLPEFKREQKIILDEPETHLPIAKEERTYIPEDAQLPDEGGATKVRGIGRFYVDDDNNFQSARNKIQDAFERAHRGSAYVNVWLLNALGGGTGSGAFPLVAAMIRFAAGESDTPQNYRLRAIGTLPRLKQSGIIHDQDYRHSVNAYAALRELRTLLDKNEGYDAEQELKLFDAPTDMVNDYLSVNDIGPLFDDYFLTGYDEQEPGTNYRERMNGMVADLILYYALVEGPEDFPDTDIRSGKEGDIYSLDNAEVSVPLDLVYEYVEKKVKATEKRNQIRAVREQASDLETYHRFLNSVENVDAGEIPDPPAEDERDRNVSPEFVRECRDQAREISDFNSEDHLEDQVQQRVSAVVDGSRPGRAVKGKFRLEHIDPESLDSARPADESPSLSERIEQFSASDVAEFFVYDHLLVDLKRERDQYRSEFNSLIDDLWDKYSGEFKEEYPDQYSRYAGTEHTNRAKGLRAFFDERLKYLREENDSILKRLGDEIEEREEDQEELMKKYHRVTSSQEDVKVVRARRRRVREAIIDARDDFDTGADLLQEEVLDTLKADLTRIENKEQAHLDDLTDSAIDTHTTIPLTGLEGLTAEDLADWVGFELGDEENWWEEDVLERLEAAAETAPTPSITGLYSDGYIDGSDIEQIFDVVMDEMGEQVEDREDRDVDNDLLDQTGETEPYSLLSILINETNTSDPDWTDEIDRIASQEAYFDGMASESVNIRNQHKVKLLGIYSNLHFAKMSEYGKVHEYHLDDSKQISEALRGDGNPAANIDDHLAFAYPELVDTSGGLSERNLPTE